MLCTYFVIRSFVHLIRYLFIYLIDSLIHLSMYVFLLCIYGVVCYVLLFVASYLLCINVHIYNISL